LIIFLLHYSLFLLNQNEQSIKILRSLIYLKTIIFGLLIEFILIFIVLFLSIVKITNEKRINEN